MLGGMELRQVGAFLAVAREGSITAAAIVIGMTQPALSRMIKALEEELGTALLERGAHSVSLTAAGEVLAKDGEKLVRMAEQIAGFSTLATAVESGMGIALVAEGGRVGSLGPRLMVRPLESGPEPVWVAAGMRAGAEPGLPCQVLVEEIRGAATEGKSEIGD